MFKVWSSSAGLLHEKCEEEWPSNNKTHNLLKTLILTSIRTREPYDDRIFKNQAGPLRGLCLEFFQLN